MKIATFNVNSVRARIPVLLEWLGKAEPDVVCLQETKVQDHEFPGEVFEEMGYNYIFKGQKKYNGVAIFSKSEINDPILGFEDEPTDKPRLIGARINEIIVVNTYVPQGFEPDSEQFKYKLEWFARLRGFFESNFEPTDPIVWVGDLNVAPLPIDVYDPVKFAGSVCFCSEVKEALEKVVGWGFTDLFRVHCSAAEQYTFWDYRIRGGVSRNLGWRLDHILVTKPLVKKCVGCYIDKEPRLAGRPSDHTPLIAEFE